jgi:hypothetical protein
VVGGYDSDGVGPGDFLLTALAESERPGLAPLGIPELELELELETGIPEER